MTNLIKKLINLRKIINLCFKIAFVKKSKLNGIFFLCDIYFIGDPRNDFQQLYSYYFFLKIIF